MAEKTIYLQDILKDSDYQQSQFNMVKIAEFVSGCILMLCPIIFMVLFHWVLM